MMLQKGMKILFQGDSVTDAGRTEYNPEGLGTGYPLLVSELLRGKYPELELECVNRAVSGNRVRDLVQRWSEDTIALDPDLLFIEIGVNDTWRRFDSNDPTGAERFEEEYRSILVRTRRETHAGLVLISPFVLPINAERMSWEEDITAKIAAVERLAEEFGAVYIPLQDILRELAEKNGMITFYAGDGVHPTFAGHQVIAGEVLKVLER